MATVFQNLRARGTLAVVGVATLASVVITTATITTLGVTTANITTANVQTLSGATIRNTAGTVIVDGTDIESTLTYSGSTVRAVSGFTGALITLKPLTGSSAVVLYGGAKGSHLCIRDTDGAGWTSVDTLNGTVTARIASASECP